MAINSFCEGAGKSFGFVATVTTALYLFGRQAYYALPSSSDFIPNFPSSDLPKNLVGKVDAFFDGHREGWRDQLGLPSSNRLTFEAQAALPKQENTGTPTADAPRPESKAGATSAPQLEQTTIWWKSLDCLTQKAGIGNFPGCISNQVTSDFYALTKIFAALATVAWLTSPGNPKPNQNLPQAPAHPAVPGDTPAYRYPGQNYQGYYPTGQAYYPYYKA